MPMVAEFEDWPGEDEMPLRLMRAMSGVAADIQRAHEARVAHCNDRCPALLRHVKKLHEGRPAAATSTGADDGDLPVPGGDQRLPDKLLAELLMKLSTDDVTLADLALIYDINYRLLESEMARYYGQYRRELARRADPRWGGDWRRRLRGRLAD